MSSTDFYVYGLGAFRDDEVCQGSRQGGVYLNLHPAGLSWVIQVSPNTEETPPLLRGRVSFQFRGWRSPTPVVFSTPVKLRAPKCGVQKDPFYASSIHAEVSTIYHGAAWSPLFGWVYLTSEDIILPLWKGFNRVNSPFREMDLERFKDGDLEVLSQCYVWGSAHDLHLRKIFQQETYRTPLFFKQEFAPEFTPLSPELSFVWPRAAL